MLKKKISEFNQALQYCFLLLKYRKRSEGEFIRRLTLRQCPEAVQKKVIAQLRESGLLGSDDEFAAEWAAYKSNSGYGINRISADLIKRGVSREAIKGLKDRFRDEKRTETRNMIRQLIEKKGHSGKTGFPERQKLTRFLLQRGFLYDDIAEVFNEVE